MKSFLKRARRTGCFVLPSALFAATLSACTTVPIIPAPPLPDMSTYFPKQVEVDMVPRLKQSCPVARIPEFAKRTGLEGWAIAGVDIGTDGRVEKLTFHALSDPRFEQAARECLEARQYYPAVNEGKAVAYPNQPTLMGRL